jgi:hypothetical protein
LSVVPQQGDDVSGLGTIRNIRIEGVVAKAEAGVVMVACPERPIENVTLSGMRLKVVPSPLDSDYGGNFDLRPCSWPSGALYAHDVPAICVEHGRNIAFRDVAVEWGGTMAAFCTDGLCATHVEGLSIDGFSGRPAPVGTGVPDAESAAIRLHHCRRAIIRGSRAEPGTPAFLAVESCDRVWLTSSDLSEAQRAVSDGSGAVRIESCWM